MRDSNPTGNTRRLGISMVTAAWLVVLALLTLFFSDMLDTQRNPNQHVNSSVHADVAEVILERNRGGHYVVTGAINGTPVEFVLDTGASDVSIPASIADQLGLEKGPSASYTTANGQIRAYQTIVDEIRLGDITMSNVRASINPHMNGNQILLGMSFLKFLEFTQRGNTLTLRQYY